MKNLAEQFTSTTHSSKRSNQETLWEIGGRSGSKIPIFKIAFQGILLLLGIGAALQFIWQLVALVPN